MTDIKKDKILLRLETLSEEISAKVKDKKLISDIKTILKVRQYRHFDKSIFKGATNNVADWAGEVAGYQAKLADIQVFIVDHQMTLKDAIDAARKHLTHKYGSSFKGTSVSSRKADVDYYLEEPLMVLGRLDKVLKIATIAEKELERSYFSSQLVKALVEISNRSGYARD